MTGDPLPPPDQMEAPWSHCWATLTEDEREDWLARADLTTGVRSIEAAFLRMCSVSAIHEILRRLHGHEPEQTRQRQGAQARSFVFHCHGHRARERRPRIAHLYRTAGAACLRGGHTPIEAIRLQLSKGSCILS